VNWNIFNFIMVKTGYFYLNAYMIMMIIISMRMSMRMSMSMSMVMSMIWCIHVEVVIIGTYFI